MATGQGKSLEAGRISECSGNRWAKCSWCGVQEEGLGAGGRGKGVLHSGLATLFPSLAGGRSRRGRAGGMETAEWISLQWLNLTFFFFGGAGGEGTSRLEWGGAKSISR